MDGNLEKFSYKKKGEPLRGPLKSPPHHRVQVLCQRFGSHRKCQTRLDLNILTRGVKSQALLRCLPRAYRIAESSLPETFCVLL